MLKWKKDGKEKKNASACGLLCCAPMGEREKGYLKEERGKIELHMFV